ncbi:MAG: NUDIX domain-containing protein [Proteobacteria bacterium]|nr:NUDIX domain-containing protein [Pseudomonadota bacterium]
MRVNARKIDGTFDTVDSENMIMRIATKAIVIQNKKILIIPQFDGYDFPGGGLEKGEHPTECIRREVYEETGFEIRVDDLIGIYMTYYIKHSDGKAYNQVNIFYFAEIIGGKLSCDHQTDWERNYQRCPEFVDFDTLKDMQFKLYIDETPEILEKIRMKLAL